MITLRNMDFHKKFRSLYRKHRYSQEDLAQELDVSQNLISLWSRGKGLPDLKQAAVLARLLQVDLNYLADDAVDEPSAIISEDDRSLIRACKALHLDYDEALRRLAGQVTVTKDGTRDDIGAKREPR